MAAQQRGPALPVSAQVTLIAYLHAPKWKAIAMSLPIPFTLGSLALGRPVDVTHMTGLGLFLAFTHIVRLLHYRAHWRILPTIVATAAGYCVIGAVLARLLPRTDPAFWTAAALVTSPGPVTQLSHATCTNCSHRWSSAVLSWRDEAGCESARVSSRSSSAVSPRVSPN